MQSTGSGIYDSKANEISCFAWLQENLKAATDTRRKIDEEVCNITGFTVTTALNASDADFDDLVTLFTEVRDNKLTFSQDPSRPRVTGKKGGVTENYIQIIKHIKEKLDTLLKGCEKTNLISRYTHATRQPNSDQAKMFVDELLGQVQDLIAQHKLKKLQNLTEADDILGELKSLLVYRSNLMHLVWEICQLFANRDETITVINGQALTCGAPIPEDYKQLFYHGGNYFPNPQGLSDDDQREKQLKRLVLDISAWEGHSLDLDYKKTLAKIRKQSSCLPDATISHQPTEFNADGEAIFDLIFYGPAKRRFEAEIGYNLENTDLLQAVQKRAEFMHSMDSSGSCQRGENTGWTGFKLVDGKIYGTFQQTWFDTCYEQEDKNSTQSNSSDEQDSRSYEEAGFSLQEGDDPASGEQAGEAKQEAEQSTTTDHGHYRLFKATPPEQDPVQ